MDIENILSKNQFNSRIEWFVNEKLHFIPPHGIYNYQLQSVKLNSIKGCDAYFLNEFDRFILGDLLGQEPEKMIEVLESDNLSLHHLVQPMRNAVQRLFWELTGIFSENYYLSDEEIMVNGQEADQRVYEKPGIPTFSKDVAFSWYKATQKRIEELFKTYGSIENFLKNGDYYDQDQWRYMDNYRNFLAESTPDAERILEKLEQNRRLHSLDDNLKIRNGLEHQMQNLAEQEEYNKAIVVRDMIKRFENKVITSCTPL